MLLIYLDKKLQQILKIKQEDLEKQKLHTGDLVYLVQILHI